MTKLLKIAAFALPACALLALSQPAPASDSSTAAAAAAISAGSSAGAQAKAAQATRHCLNLVLETGSRMTRRVCKTKAEWADEGVDLDAKK